MSRLARRPIPLPPSTEVTLSEGEVRVKGPKGALARPAHRLVSIEIGKEGVSFAASGGATSGEARAMVGTYAAHVRNMLEGVTKGFTKRLLIEGVGYRWDVQGKTLNLSLGFSHPVALAIPEGLTVAVEKGVLSVTGNDKEQVGQFAANVRALKKPEPYKGKGIRYEGEVIRRKQGKKAA